MNKVLCIILVFTMVTGLTFSATMSVATQTVANIQNAFTTVADRFGLTQFSGEQDLTPDENGIFNLGYYTFQGERIPVWSYIDVILGDDIYESGIYIQSVSPRMYQLQYKSESGQYLYDSFIRMQVQGTLYDVLPITGYIYYSLEYEIAFFSMSYLTGIKRVELGANFWDRLTILLPSVIGGARVIEQEDITVNEYVNNLID